MATSENIAELCQRTPLLQVIGNRGQVVRVLQYNRSPGQGVELDERVTRQTVSALGYLDSQIDPRLFDTHGATPNLRYGLSLSGQTLRTDSVDAGQRYQLPDIEGRPYWSRDSRGQQHQFHYDQLGRASFLIEQQSGQMERVCERWQYGEEVNAAGCNLRGQVAVHYDTAGMRRATAYSLQGQPLCISLQLLSSDRQDSDWPQSKQDQWPRQLAGPAYVTTWGYDALGGPITQQDAQGNIQQSHYNVAGQAAKLTLLRAGASTPIVLQAIDYTASGQKLRDTTGNQVVTDYQYEAQTQRLQRVTTHRPAGNGPTLLQDLVYVYDPVGNILSVTDESKTIRYFANQQVAPISRYDYDALYQLVSATGRESTGTQDLGGRLPAWQRFPTDPGQLVNYHESYVYDRGGNLTDLHHQGAVSYHRRLSVAHDSNRAVLSQGGGDLAGEFDACGNLLRLSPAGQGLQWDGRNQLREVMLVERPEEATDHESYQYDGDGMRVRKQRSRLASGVNRREEVIYLPGLELRTRYANEEVQERLVVIVSTGARVLCWEQGWPESIPNNSIRYSLDNHLGSSILELDEQARLITAEEYYPYGGTACWLARSEIEAKYKMVRYSGKERDETGLYYYGYRYYAPWLGRWLNPDPAGTVDGFNLYWMVRNNPIKYIDTMGLLTDTAKAAIEIKYNEKSKKRGYFSKKEKVRKFSKWAYEKHGEGKEDFFRAMVELFVEKREWYAPPTSYRPPDPRAVAEAKAQSIKRDAELNEDRAAVLFYQYASPSVNAGAREVTGNSLKSEPNKLSGAIGKVEVENTQTTGVINAMRDLAGGGRQRIARRLQDVIGKNAKSKQSAGVGPAITWSGQRMTPDALHKLKMGGQYKLPNFLSTSGEKDLAIRFLRGDYNRDDFNRTTVPALFRIEGITGMSLNSSERGERETLYSYNAAFDFSYQGCVEGVDLFHLTERSSHGVAGYLRYS
ncbi:RHS repeat protein [Chromobacterium haemolyticum]|uniref:RHS repeat protein n=1 Tax=Chromobacterium fluminis TaxID=3044269 RepID=A0ABX0LFR0_9NEIS|nr:RHS repeat protein [Chromobacterium haemolyticum]NHR07245.1 RHS repeat protein [Chromobacterium haemolyticum]